LVHQVKQAIAELKDSFGDLLQRRRAGVVASLLAASGRLRAGQVMLRDCVCTTFWHP